jgi:type II secretory pathway component PulF
VELDDGQRAELFLGLGRSLGAGLTATQALEALQGICDGVLDTALDRAANAVGKGSALTATLQRQGLATDMDRVLLAAGEASGSVDLVCQRLADRYARAHARWRQLKGRLMLPGAVLLIGILVLPLPALAAGRLTVSGYVLRAGAAIVTLLAAARLASRAVRRWRTTGTPGWLTRLARLLPGIATTSRLHQRADASERLSLALLSGLPAADALDAMHRVEGNTVRRSDLVQARRTLRAGGGLADALAGAGLLDAPGYAIVSAGEGAGRLDDCLDRVARASHEALDQRYALLAQWIPVVVYLLVAGTVAAGILA